MIYGKRLLIALVALVLASFLSACSAGTTTASCAWTVGSGRDGYDAKVHDVIYPGQAYTPVSGYNIYYIPCNSRNYKINDGTERDANNVQVGDRHILITAYTKTGVGMTVKATAYWTPNESYQAMLDLYKVCFKYTCWSTDDKGGTANYSTTGWNGMLSETFSPTMDAATMMAAIKVDDSIWQKHDPEQYQALADAMSKNFGPVMQAALGYQEDLFCGSGNSVWTDPDHPGDKNNPKNKFICTPVRIVVEEVKLLPNQADQNSVGAAALNAQRLESAKALYGENAPYWLGLMDAIDHCRGSNTPCIINIGGTSGGPAIVVPSNNAAPTPATSPTPKK